MVHLVFRIRRTLCRPASRFAWYNVPRDLALKLGTTRMDVASFQHTPHSHHCSRGDDGVLRHTETKPWRHSSNFVDISSMIIYFNPLGDGTPTWCWGLRIHTDHTHENLYEENQARSLLGVFEAEQSLHLSIHHHPSPALKKSLQVLRSCCDKGRKHPPPQRG